MVIELILNPTKLQGKKWEIFVIGFFYSLMALILSIWVFKEYASIVMITLTVIAALPFVHRIIEIEEEKDVGLKGERRLLKEHRTAIFCFLLLFLGFVASFVIVFLVLPSEMTNTVFSVQIGTVNAVKSSSATDLTFLQTIFFNNCRVMLFCLLFSFLYGAGAIFVLTWNATVIAAAFGMFVRGVSSSNYLIPSVKAFLMYLTHGIPEIIAFFIAALASGILSFAVVKQDFMGKRFNRILKDSTILFSLGLIILFIAALIEVYITPMLVF